VSRTRAPRGASIRSRLRVLLPPDRPSDPGPGAEFETSRSPAESRGRESRGRESRGDSNADAEDRTEAPTAESVVRAAPASPTEPPPAECRIEALASEGQTLERATVDRDVSQVSGWTVEGARCGHAVEGTDGPECGTTTGRPGSVLGMASTFVHELVDVQGGLWATLKGHPDGTDPPPRASAPAVPGSGIATAHEPRALPPRGRRGERWRDPRLHLGRSAKKHSRPSFWGGRRRRGRAGGRRICGCRLHDRTRPSAGLDLTDVLRHPARAGRADRRARAVRACCRRRRAAHPRGRSPEGPRSHGNGHLRAVRERRLQLYYTCSTNWVV